MFEPYNGTVFYAEDPDAPWFPASLTKLMTALLVADALADGEIVRTSGPIATQAI